MLSLLSNPPYILLEGLAKENHLLFTFLKEKHFTWKCTSLLNTRNDVEIPLCLQFAIFLKAWGI